MTAGTLSKKVRDNRWPHVQINQFDRLAMMDIVFMDQLEQLCALALNQNGWTHRINSDYRSDGRIGSMHRIGKAVDIVFYRKQPGDVTVWEQYDFAVGSKIMMRVGAYPYWNTPGLHVDAKPARLYWLCDTTGAYRYALEPDAVKELA